jgi:hypothetical protein
MKETIFMTTLTALLFTLKVTGLVPLTWFDIFVPFLIYFVLLGVVTWWVLISKNRRQYLMRLLAKDLYGAE